GTRVGFALSRVRCTARFSSVLSSAHGLGSDPPKYRRLLPWDGVSGLWKEAARAAHGLQRPLHARLLYGSGRAAESCDDLLARNLSVLPRRISPLASTNGHGSFPAGRPSLLLTMLDLLEKRILFFGGKGGVGKTTCASALALAAAKRGKRVLLVSTDPAHSTSDIFERLFSREEEEIYPGIVGVEVDGDFEARRYIETVKNQIAKLFSSSVLKEAERQIELVSTMP